MCYVFKYGKNSEQVIKPHIDALMMGMSLDACRGVWSGVTADAECLDSHLRGCGGDSVIGGGGGGFCGSYVSSSDSGVFSFVKQGVLIKLLNSFMNIHVLYMVRRVAGCSFVIGGWVIFFVLI